MIDSDWLRTFVVFAEDVNLSRAAKRLHLSQPAVHAHLKRLGETVGVPLYRRVGRGLALTREGVAVLAFARDAAERERELVARLRGEGDDGTVVLAAGAGAVLYVLGEGLRAHARRASTQVEIVTCDAPRAIELVTSGAAHVAVAATDARPEGAVVHRVTEVPPVVVLPRHHPLARRRRLALAHLDGERLVLPPEGRPHRVALESALMTRGVAFTVGAVAQGWELTMELVRLGAGISVVNACCRLPTGLVARPIGELPSVRYVAMTRPMPRNKAKVLLSALVEHGEAWRSARDRAGSATALRA